MFFPAAAQPIAQGPLVFPDSLRCLGRLSGWLFRLTRGYRKYSGWKWDEADCLATWSVFDD